LAKKPLTTRQARAGLASPDADRREAVVQELEAIGAGEITDVIRWTETGDVLLVGSDDISDRARRAIKKVKVTPNQPANST